MSQLLQTTDFHSPCPPRSAATDDSPMSFEGINTALTTQSEFVTLVPLQTLLNPPQHTYLFQTLLGRLPLSIIGVPGIPGIPRLLCPQILLQHLHQQ